MDFVPFPKLSRLSREMVVTEKLDGTNAQIYIEHKDAVMGVVSKELVLGFANDHYLFAGSRTQWLSKEKDNFGFANWAAANAEELFKLGPGQHFGEWWGAGIQRTYDLKEKRFSLFNTTRWITPYLALLAGHDVKAFPKCCSVVPELYRGVFDTQKVDDILAFLERNGSVASKGFMQPEGVVVFHMASNEMFKKTLDKNDTHKGVVNGPQ